MMRGWSTGGVAASLLPWDVCTAVVRLPGSWVDPWDLSNANRGS